MGHTLRAGPAAAERFSPYSLHEFGHRHPEPLRQPAQHAQRGIMPAEFDPRQIAAAYVGFAGECLLTQATGRSQPLELLCQGSIRAALLTWHSRSTGQARPSAANWGQSRSLDKWPEPLPGVGPLTEG